MYNNNQTSRLSELFILTIEKVGFSNLLISSATTKESSSLLSSSFVPNILWTATKTVENSVITRPTTYILLRFSSKKRKSEMKLYPMPKYKNIPTVEGLLF